MQKMIFDKEYDENVKVKLFEFKKHVYKEQWYNSTSKEVYDEVVHEIDKTRDLDEQLDIIETAINFIVNNKELCSLQEDIVSLQYYRRWYDELHKIPYSFVFIDYLIDDFRKLLCDKVLFLIYRVIDRSFGKKSSFQCRRDLYYALSSKVKNLVDNDLKMIRNNIAHYNKIPYWYFLKSFSFIPEVVDEIQKQFDSIWNASLDLLERSSGYNIKGEIRNPEILKQPEEMVRQLRSFLCVVSKKI